MHYTTKLFRNKDGSDDDFDNNNELELPSLESINSSDGSLNRSPFPGTTTIDSKRKSASPAKDRFSPTSDSELNSQPTSLTDSMAMVNHILADVNLDRVERIEKLEAVLADVTMMALGKRSNSTNALSERLAKVDAETQTISTGDISMTKVYSPKTVASPLPT